MPVVITKQSVRDQMSLKRLPRVEMPVVITKQSVRDQTSLKRLPRKFGLLVDGGWLYLVLKANNLHEKIRLWHQRYWVRARSLDAKRLVLTVRIDK